MHTNSKHLIVQLGIWTVVANKSSFLIPEWLPNISTIAIQLWKIMRSKLFTSESKGSLRKDKSNKIPDTSLAIEIRTVAHLFSLTKEIYLLGPVYFALEMIMNGWEMASGALELYFTSRILSSISRCLETGEFQPLEVVHALTYRILLAIASELLSTIREKYTAILSSRVTYHFVAKTMHTALNFDLLTAEDPEVRSKLSGSSQALSDWEPEVWMAFNNIKEALFGLLTILSQLSLILSLSRSSSTFTLSIALCLLQPLLEILSTSLYSRSFVIYCNNAHFARMSSLHNLAFEERFREDCLSNNFGPYIEKEFKKSRNSLGDVCTEHPYLQWMRNGPLSTKVLNALSADLTLIFFALRMLWDHSSTSLNELILVQQASQSVQATLSILLFNIKRVSHSLLTIRNLYTLSDTPNKVKDGETRYPLNSDERAHSGAEVEFRNVSFKYPGTDKNALTDISFTIKPGQLVAIVGVNGSGKSSAIKLLTRLHDPSDGEILLDGRPLPSYKLADVHRTTAVLRQDHAVLPLSLRENVALGLPERDATAGEIEDAILQGGAEKIVQKLKQGPETVLDPVKTTTTHFVGETDAALKAVLDEKETKTDLSGGETQRLSASRTFMRLMGGNIRLLVADEPTSALDPEGEYELFTRLRQHSGGKTVIFITHRFGHLTKYADLILCLKDGRLVEQGTHEMLIAKGGEYKRLHNVQAKAFISKLHVSA